MTSHTPDANPPEKPKYPATTYEIITAQHEGMAALLANRTLSECPYIGDRTPRGRFLAIMWQRGWRAKQKHILAAAHDRAPMPAARERATSDARAESTRPARTPRTRKEGT